MTSLTRRNLLTSVFAALGGRWVAKWIPKRKVEDSLVPWAPSPVQKEMLRVIDAGLNGTWNGFVEVAHGPEDLIACNLLSLANTKFDGGKIYRPVFFVRKDDPPTP